MAERLAFNPLDFEATIGGEAVAIKFHTAWMQIDPRHGDQKVTTCYIRPLAGPRELYVGTAVVSPHEEYELPLYGKKLALARAVFTFIPGINTREAWKISRRVIWDWLKAQDDREALEAALQELDRLEETRTADPALREEAQALRAKIGSLPAGPVSQFLSK